MGQFLVVTLVCPECKMSAHLPVSTFREAIRFQPWTSKGEPLRYVLCDACNRVSARSTTIPLPCMYDRDNPPPGALYENLFVVSVPCDGQACESHVLFLAPKGAHYTKRNDLLSEASLWKFAPKTTCDHLHGPRFPTHPLKIEINRIIPPE